MNISNNNRSNTVEHSSLSQSPQPVVRFGNSLDKRSMRNYYSGWNVNKVSTAGSTIRIAHHNNGGGYHLIKRRSTGVNLVNSPNILSDYQQHKYSGNQIFRPS